MRKRSHAPPCRQSEQQQVALRPNIIRLAKSSCRFAAHPSPFASLPAEISAFMQSSTLWTPISHLLDPSGVKVATFWNS
jgi:hypothetical protein